MRTLLLGLAAIVLAGCGGGSSSACVLASCVVQSQSPAAKGSQAGSPAAGASQAIIVIIDDTVSSGGSVRLVRADGTEVQRLALKSGAQAVRAAGSRIFVLEDGGAVKALHRDGSVEDLGSLGAPSPFGFVVSPDGSRWMWGTVDGRHGQVHMAGDGMSPRVVAESNEDARSIQPYSWTPVAAFLADNPIGIGGYILFNPARGPVSRLDPASFSSSPVAHTGDCAFSDMRSDGTIACFDRAGGNQNQPSLSLIGPDGKVSTIQLATPRFNRDGDRYFSPDGKLVSVGGAVGSGVDNPPEQYATDIVTVSDQSIKRLPLDQVRPAGAMQRALWLPDGSMVVYRPRGGAGGAAGVFVSSPSGASRQITQGGTPIGVLAG